MKAFSISAFVSFYETKYVLTNTTGNMLLGTEQQLG